jgi:hypothetical protein
MRLSTWRPPAFRALARSRLDRLTALMRVRSIDRSSSPHFEVFKAMSKASFPSLHACLRARGAS